MFTICHKGSYGLSSSSTVLQIFTLRCEDMPETHLWATIGQWDCHPWPDNKTQLLCSLSCLQRSLMRSSALTSRDGSYLQGPLMNASLKHSCSQILLWPLKLVFLSSYQGSLLKSWALKGSSSGLQLLRGCKLQFQQTQRTSLYSCEARYLRGIREVSTSSCAKDC